MELVLKGQRSAKRILEACARRGNRSALLFTGPEHSGRLHAAKAYGAYLNNEAPTSWLKEQHPDLLIVRPVEGKSQTLIEQARDVIRFDAKKSFQSASKVVVIRRAETLTVEASNALLKTIEEPSPDTLVILIALGEQEVLQTISSRCLIVHFHRLSLSAVQEIMGEQITPDEFRVMSRHLRLPQSLTEEEILLLENTRVAVQRMLSTDRKSLTSYFEDSEKYRPEDLINEVIIRAYENPDELELAERVLSSLRPYPRSLNRNLLAMSVLAAIS